jgi:hypothetical protein
MAPNMLGYSITSSTQQPEAPFIVVGVRGNSSYIAPANAQPGCYWIVILNASNPKQKVKEWLLPAKDHSTVPPDLDAYMSNPAYIFAVVTYWVGSSQVPQGAFYDFLVKYGASRELQKLEQVNVLTFCGSFSSVSYILTGQCGPRTPAPPPSYEASSAYFSTEAILLLSLESLPNGQPPYGIVNTYTWK